MTVCPSITTVTATFTFAPAVLMDEARRVGWTAMAEWTATTAAEVEWPGMGAAALEWIATGAALE